MNNTTNTSEDRYDRITLLDPGQTLDRVKELLSDTAFVEQAAKAFAARGALVAAYVLAVQQGLPRQPGAPLMEELNRCYLGLYADERMMRADILGSLGLTYDRRYPDVKPGALAEILHGDEEGIWHRFRDLFYVVPGTSVASTSLPTGI